MLVFTVIILILLLLISYYKRKQPKPSNNNPYISPDSQPTRNPNGLYALRFDCRKPVIENKKEEVWLANEYPIKPNLTHKSTDFVVFDFETANTSRHSACALGLAIVKDLQVVETKHFYISPQHSEYFIHRFVELHGISWDQVYDKPFFHQIWPEIESLFQNNLLIAYNVNFDISVLKETLNYYGIPLPKLKCNCALAYARRHFEYLHNYKLSTVCQYLEIELQHHQAESDARAAAEVTIRIVQKLQEAFYAKHPEKAAKPLTQKMEPMMIPEDVFEKVKLQLYDVPPDPTELKTYLESLKRNIRRNRQLVLQTPENATAIKRYQEYAAKYILITGKDYS